MHVGGETVVGMSIAWKQKKKRNLNQQTDSKPSVDGENKRDTKRRWFREEEYWPIYTCRHTDSTNLSMHLKPHSGWLN